MHDVTQSHHSNTQKSSGRAHRKPRLQLTEAENYEK
jgi:hypothetical protein